MDLQKLLSTPEIKKTVDDDVFYQRDDFGGFQNVPKEVKDIQVDTELPIQNIIDDLTSLAKVTEEEAQDLYNSIVFTTDQDAQFMEYLDLIESYIWDPMSLVNDTDSKPDPTVDYKKLQDYELTNFQQFNNPEVLFLQDIRRIVAESRYIQYLGDYAWSSLDRHYKNEDNQNADNLIRIHLFTETERLNQKRSYLKAIKTTSNVSISTTFLSALINSVNLTTPVASQEFAQVITQTLKTMHALRPYFKLAIIASSYNWLNLKTILNDLWGTYYNVTVNSYTRAFMMSAGSFVNKGIFELIDSLENFSGLDIQGTGELAEFKGMINSVLSSNLSQIEQELIEREVKENTTHHTRYMKLIEANKVTKAKKYLELIDEIILKLELLRANFNTLGDYNQFELNRLVLSFQEKLVREDTKRKQYVS